MQLAGLIFLVWLPAAFAVLLVGGTLAEYLTA